MTADSHRYALVTGGSRGLGAAISKSLAREGFQILLNFAGNTEAAERTATEIRNETGVAVHLLPFSVADSTAVDQNLESLFGKSSSLPPGARLECLVNNAGIAIDGLLMRFSNADIDRVLEVNLKGAIYCARAASKIMMRQRSGSMIHIASVVGESGNAGQSVYAASKSALFGFSHSLALELASRGIRSNVVTPGFIQTEMTDRLTEAQKEAILRNIPMGTLGTPEDVAHLVSFLASPKSRYITGQVWGVNGGLRNS